MQARYWFFAMLLSIHAVPACRGAWLGFRNNTARPLIVQTITPGGNRPENAKTANFQRLFPGEVSWGSVVKSGVRRIVVYDARQPDRILATREITIQAQDLFFSLGGRGSGPVNIASAPIPRKRP